VSRPATKVATTNDYLRSSWLTGRRVVVTRAEEQAQELFERLQELGAEPIAFPVIAIAPPEAGGSLDQALARLDSYDWLIFTSVNGVNHFGAQSQELNDHTKIAAVGPATAQALRQRGLPVYLVPREHRAEAILDEIGDVSGQRILLPSADIARPTLAEGLRARGAQVERVTAYHTVLGEPAPDAFDALRASVDVVVFSSSSSVRNFLTLTKDLDYGQPLIACIGPVTAATARKLGLGVDIVPQEYTINGLIDALKNHPCEGF
jgi:uroporphyrinogen-III synthase